MNLNEVKIWDQKTSYGNLNFIISSLNFDLLNNGFTKDELKECEKIKEQIETRYGCEKIIDFRVLDSLIEMNLLVLINLDIFKIDKTNGKKKYILNQKISDIDINEIFKLSSSSYNKDIALIILEIYFKKINEQLKKDSIILDFENNFIEAKKTLKEYFFKKYSIKNGNRMFNPFFKHYKYFNKIKEKYNLTKLVELSSYEQKNNPQTKNKKVEQSKKEYLDQKKLNKKNKFNYSDEYKKQVKKEGNSEISFNKFADIHHINPNLKDTYKDNLENIIGLSSYEHMYNAHSNNNKKTIIKENIILFYSYISIRKNVNLENLQQQIVNNNYLNLIHDNKNKIQNIFKNNIDNKINLQKELKKFNKELFDNDVFIDKKIGISIQK